MTEFFGPIFSFPVVPFTIVLFIVLAYWALILLGALDVEFLDSLGGLEDAAEGVGEAAEGLGGGAGLLHALGLGGVPLTISLSVFALYAWVLSLGGSWLIAWLGLGGLMALLAGTAVALVAPLVALVPSARTVRPLRGIFRTVEAAGRESLVGKICTITTLTVDEGFGQAEAADGGAGNLIQVRAPAGNTLTRGSRALIFDYDGEHEFFLVAPAGRNLSGTPAVRVSRGTVQREEA